MISLPTKVELREQNASIVGKFMQLHATKGNDTTTMNNHLLNKCPKLPHTLDDGKELISFISSSTKAKKRVIDTWKFDQAKIGEF